MMSKHRLQRALLVSAGLFLLGGTTAVRAQSVEAIMRARESLELSEQQIAQLDEIRRERVALRSAEMAEIAELRSQLEAGQIRRSELMAAMENQRDARAARAEGRRASIDAILTEAQLERVEQMRRRGRRVGRDFGPRDRSDRGPRARPRPGARSGPGA